jgi:transposase
MALPGSASTVVNNVKTQGIGFAPILRHYLEKCTIAGIIDKNVATDPRRKVLTHGQAAVAMITGILFQVMQLYRICQLACQSTVLEVIFPGIKPEEYFDDRLADTLDALYYHGIGDLELELTRHMIDTFNVRTDSCHNDTTSVSYYGEAGCNKSDESIQITFGHSKKHREDLKQLVLSMSVSSDSGFPLFQQAYSGNTADVTTYVEQWQNLIDLLGKRDFVFVADCKLISKENVASLCDNGGFFLAPAPMYESYTSVFDAALAGHDQEMLIPYKDRINRGFEVPMTICHQEKDYSLRMIILFDHNLGRIKRKGLESRIAKTRAAFQNLESQLNHRKLKNRENIEKASTAVLKRYQTGGFFIFRLTNTPVVTYKNKHRGRPGKNKPMEKTEVITDHFALDYIFDQNAYDAALSKCGYYPLLTNQSLERLSIGEAMLEHKAQYNNEHLFRRAKSCYDLEPVYLHYPRRIEAYLLLFKVALQMVVLIERAARKNIQHRDRGLDDFMPNRKDVRNPRAEYLLQAFQYTVMGLIPMPDGANHGFVSELGPLQLDILEILEVPVFCFSYQYLADSS